MKFVSPFEKTEKKTKVRVNNKCVARMDPPECVVSCYEGPSQLTCQDFSRGNAGELRDFFRLGTDSGVVLGRYGLPSVAVAAKGRPYLPKLSVII